MKDIEGDLIIKEYPTKTATPQMIRNHLEKLRQRDINVDMVLVDYGDLLRPNIVRKREEARVGKPFMKIFSNRSGE